MPENTESNAAIEVKSQVSEILKTKNPQLQTRVVEFLVGQELNERESAAVKVLNKIEEKSKELQKMKPDSIQFDEAGKEVKMWTAEGKKKKDAAIAEIKKLNDALAKAFAGEDWSQVKQLSK